MSLERIKQRLFAQSIKDSKWLEQAKWRAENEAWLDISFSIALAIGRWLRANGMSQKELAERLGYSPQYVSKILKGSENLTLETISKIEKVLDIKLIEVPVLEFAQNEFEAVEGKYSTVRTPLEFAQSEFEADELTESHAGTAISGRFAWSESEETSYIEADVEFPLPLAQEDVPPQYGTTPE
ncbi:MAG: multiprotein-bridging factor 1 family protein [Saprospiraceae bacterium]